ncbi:hypothetical protein Pcac1_g19967 [Phytophthora cactorum]|nr:hypothetical protein Pcac1_g19967 [Phytophthora cactorum]
MSPWRMGKSHPQQPTPSRPQSRMIRSHGRVDPMKMIRALQVRSARVMMKKRRHRRRVTPSSPRSVPTERAPWMPSASRFGATSPPNPIPLYVCSAIIDDAEAAAQHFDPMTNQRRDYFIGLFHELRWHASKRTSRKSKVPEWVALCQSWNAFVENFNKDAKAYRARITAAQRRFETFSRRHMIDRLHNEAIEVGIPCAVPFGTACSHCPPWG